MYYRRALGARLPRLRRWGVLAFALFVLPCAAAQAQTDFVRVEEDWELVVLDADVASNGPQVTCVISPSGGVDSYYVSLEINFRSLPSYTAGGLQYQMWNGEEHLLTKSFPESRVMSTPGETVRWTQSMSLTGGKVTYEVVAGTSTTWGQFGGQGYLRATVETGLLDLSAYSPAASVAHSGIGFASNRVQKLELTRVRYVLANGIVVEDNTPRAVFQHE